MRLLSANKYLTHAGQQPPAVKFSTRWVPCGQSFSSSIGKQSTNLQFGQTATWKVGFQMSSEGLIFSVLHVGYITFYIGPAAERRKEPSQIPGQALINSGEWCVKVCAWKQCVEFHSISFFKHIGLGKYSTPRLRDSASLPLGWG